MLISVCVPAIQEVVQQKRYELDSSTVRLVGKTAPNLAKKFTYDSQNAQWQFNKDGIVATPTQPSSGAGPDIAAAMQLAKAQAHMQVGGEGSKDTSLYSVNLPADGSKGLTYYDTNTNLSFSLVPEFKVSAGQDRNGQLIYPFQDGGKLIYTAKNNGLKEDIVLSHNIGDTLRFSYKLQLPNTLEAKIQEDGSVGVFSADPTLFGNISYGSNADQAKIESARQTAPKDHLLFVIPAPVIKQSGRDSVGASAQFNLDGDELFINASGLSKLHYPVSVDPSVVITSATDFTTGNNEDNIDFGSGQIARGGLTGGTTGTWTPTTSFTTARQQHTTVAYNVYLYILGGSNGSPLNDVQYAPINATTGAIGTWTATTSFTTARYDHASVAYNGYLYILGGADLNGNPLNDVQYAPINASGTVGTWTATTSFTTIRQHHTTVVYNGYLYVIGGYSGSSFLNDIQYSQIDKAGAITSFNTLNTLPTETSHGKSYTARSGATSVVYNGYIYVIGGYTATPAAYYYSSVTYAHINADGTIGLWTSATGFTTGRVGHTSVVYNGRIYIIGGYGGSLLSDVQYASIGTFPGPGGLGPWATTTPLPVALDNHTSVVYNGYLYVIGGHTTSYLNSVLYAPINADGTIGAWHYTHNSTDDGTTFVAGFTNARENHASAISGNYVYILGGDAGSTYYNDVQYAPINANGTIGIWTTLNSFTSPRHGDISFIDNGYLYVIAGYNGTSYFNDVQYAPINANGTIGTWITSSSSFTTARQYPAATAVYGGYFYVIGGDSGATYYNDIQYAAINNGGSGMSNAWTATSSFTTARYGQATVAYNGYIYVLGGETAVNTPVNDVQYATINTNGTVGTWTATSSFTGVRDYFGSFAYNGYLYIVGGLDDAGGNTLVSKDVQYAPINATTGAVGTWTTAAGTVGEGYGLSVAVYNGYAYAMGGTAPGVTPYHNTVEYAPINATTGAIGTWTATTSFTTARAYHTSVAYNGYLYVIGGYNGTSSTYLNDVQYAPINATTGAVGTWTATNSFTTARAHHTSVAYNGYLYVIGGYDGTNYLNDVQYAPINANGTIGTWTTTTSFTTARDNHTGVVYGGYLYILGGWNGTTYYSDVQFSPLNVIDRAGYYTKLLDLGTNVTLDSISFTGILPNSTKSIAYRTAGANGVFGTASTRDTLTGNGTGLTCTTGTSANTRYVWLSVTMDDSLSGGVFPDIYGTNNAYLSDITVNYKGQHAPPNLRLHGGKYFQNELQQPLDTCGP